MASQSNGLRPTFHRSDFSRSRILFDDIRPTALPCRSSRNVRLATKARCFGNLQESFQLRNQGSRVFPDPLNNLIQLVNQFWSLFSRRIGYGRLFLLLFLFLKVFLGRRANKTLKQVTQPSQSIILYCFLIALTFRGRASSSSTAAEHGVEPTAGLGISVKNPAKLVPNNTNQGIAKFDTVEPTQKK